MSRKKHHAENHEEHIDEGWLIPYADLLTLLLALFIVLFACAQVDAQKLNQMAQSFSAAFSSGNPSVLENIQTRPKEEEGVPKEQQLDKITAASSSAKDQAYKQENEQLTEVQKVLDKYITDNNLDGALATVMTEEGLMIRIKDTALFSSGSADLITESRRFGSQIAKMILVLPQKIIISGHTDNVPINTREFPSNWDLSSKRALNFMKFLLTQEKLQPERFSAIGFGEYHPVVPNDSNDGRSQNRRVEVLILRNYKPAN